MLLTYLWIYTIFLVIMWVFFMIARFHLYRFRNFSESIKSVTLYLSFFLIFLSILWYVLIFLLWLWWKEVKIVDYKEVNEVYY